MNSHTTDPQEELLVEVDLSNKILGSIPRKIAHESPNKIYRTISILVKDSQNKILIQKKALPKTFIRIAGT